MKNKTTAMLLALFLGGIGIHKFYLGKNIMGLIYIAFAWSLIPALIGFIDFIRLAVMSEDDFNYFYNKRAV